MRRCSYRAPRSSPVFDGDPRECQADDGTPVLCVDVNNGLVKLLHDDMRRDGPTVDKALVNQVWGLGAETGPADP